MSDRRIKSGEKKTDEESVVYKRKVEVINFALDNKKEIGKIFRKIIEMIEFFRNSPGISIQEIFSAILDILIFYNNSRIYSPNKQELEEINNFEKELEIYFKNMDNLDNIKSVMKRTFEEMKK